MKLREYFAPLLKWWWLLLLAMIIAGLSAYITTRPLPRVYEARSSLMIGRLLSSLNPTQEEIVLGQQLAQTYSDIALREPVRLAAMKTLGLNDLPPYTAHPLSGPFMEIVVTYTDPKIAQAVANELANQLILFSPASLAQTDLDTQTFLEQQLKDVQTKIQKTQEDIIAKQSQLASLDNAVQISQAQSELDALDTRLTSLQTIYANMASGMPQGARNQISIYELATLPRYPVGPNKSLIIALAALAGAILAAGAAYAIEALDTSVKSPEEVTRLLELPVIGRVSSIPANKKNWTYVNEEPQSAITEDFRLLRTNLEFFGVDHPLKTFMISSADMGDGKSTVASNLALVMSMGEKTVILVDADFRRPILGDAFELDQSLGLSDVVSRGIPLGEALSTFPGSRQLRILPAGTNPPNPTELLGSARMAHVLAELKGMADLIIIDGPPFIVSDASVLATQVDGLVVVVRTGHTHRSAISVMREQINHIGANVLGVVLNQLPARSSYYASRYTAPPPQKRKPKPASEAGAEIIGGD